MPGHFWDVIRLLDCTLSDAHCCSEEERLVGAVLHELLFQNLQHPDVIIIILRRFDEMPISVFRETVVASDHWILPINVKAIEAPIPAKTNDIPRESSRLRFRGSYGAEYFACVGTLAIAILASTVV